MNNESNSLGKDLVKDKSSAPPFNPTFDEELLSQNVKSVSKVSRHSAPTPPDIKGVFPESVKSVINSLQEGLQFNEQFIVGAILYVASVAIGNSYRVKVKTGHFQSASIFLALVGNPGTGKSQPIQFLEKPITKRDSQEYLRYKEELSKYNAYEKLNAKEKRTTDEVVRPIFCKTTISDSTSEARIKAIENNPRGIGLCVDELIKMIKEGGRYTSSGGVSEELNSIFSGIKVVVDRKSQEPIYITKPFLSIIGTIQPSVLPELSKDYMGVNGFTDRILFMYPEGLKKQPWTDTDINPNTEQLWEDIVVRLFSLNLSYDDSDKLTPSVIRFESEARNLLFQWQHKLTNEINTIADNSLQSRLCKLDTYVVRLSLILQLLKWACDEETNNFISERTVRGAITLAEYFKGTSQSIVEVMIHKNKYSILDQTTKIFYDTLPTLLNTSDAVAIGDRLGISESKVKRLIKDTSLFDRIKHGQYEKKC